MLHKFLIEKEVARLDVDSENRVEVHRAILERKALLKAVFNNFHDDMMHMDTSYFEDTVGLRLELGAGVYGIRESYPDVLASDIVDAPHLDQVVDAENMDFPDGSIRSIYGQNCFHHFPHPDKFFSELDRVLAPGGGAILLEPYHGPFASFLFKRLFATEGFDKKFPSWETPSTGPMNGANQALSYIVFVRDKADFNRKHPNLRVVHQHICKNYLSYLVSGGLNFRQLIPNSMIFIVEAVQFLLTPLAPLLGLHHITVIRKSK